jgi:hypothetical protein
MKRFFFSLFSLLPAVLASGQDSAAPFGEQRSASGIKHSFFITGSKTAIIGEDSRILWQIPDRSRDGFVLPNGNILVSLAKEVREYTRAGEIVFRYALAPENGEMGTSVRLENGHTMIVERGKKPRLIEVDAAAKIVKEVPLQPETENVHMQTRMARPLPNGNYLVPHLLAFKVKEYRPDGSVVTVFPTDLEELGGRKEENWPFTAIRLANGNTLVNLTHGNKTVEFDAGGKVVWKVTNADVGGRFADPCGGQRLANGNTVICSYGQKAADKPKAFEITRDKSVAWEYVNTGLTGIHEIHVLTTNGEPVPWPPLK